METTPNLALPLIMGSQSQKHVTHNEALSVLDRLVHLSVVDDHRNEPPAAPGVGDLHIVGSSPAGAWAGKAGAVALNEGEFWRFFMPVEGWRAWIRASAGLKVYGPDGWLPVTASAGGATLGVNTSADATNLLAVKADGVLFSHDDVTPGTGSARLQINRAAPADSAHVHFSSDWTVRAEAGLVGDDLFRLKVSPDGTTFSTALAVDTATGAIGINADPTADRLAVCEDKAGATQFTVNNLDTATGAAAAFRLNAANGHFFSFQLYGTGFLYGYTNAAMVLGTYADKPLTLRTDTVDRMYVHGDGRVSINASEPSAQLSVNGAVRVGAYAKEALPSAGANGAGAMILVSNATGGSAIAFSDGTTWRRIADGSVVN